MREVPGERPPACRVGPVAGRGRGLLAARALAPGQEALREAAALLLPDHTAALCLSCLGPTARECGPCGAPLCCPEGHAAAECALLRRWGTDREGSTLALALYRLEGLEQVAGLEAHLEERRAEPGWAALLERVVAPLAAARPGLTEARAELLLGVFLTNSVVAGPGLVGLFPTFSRLNHSCRPNVRWSVEGGQVWVRACLPVAEGEELVGSYTSVELGTVARRPLLLSTWHFACSCPRCTDPTEGGSNLSGLACPACPGPLLPARPLEPGSPWTCAACPRTLPAPEAEARHQAMLGLLAGSVWTADELESEVVPGLLRTGHPSHYLVLRAKRALALLLRGPLPPALLARKAALCEEWLVPLGRAAPGPSPARAALQELLAGALVGLAGPGARTGALAEAGRAVRLVGQAWRGWQLGTAEEQEAFGRRCLQLLSLEAAAGGE